MKKIRILRPRDRYKTIIEVRQNKIWRAKVLKRDGYKCEFPHCCSNKHLNVHHIQRFADAPTLRFDVQNGITLCRIHHKFITGQELIYQPLFMQIVYQNAKHTS